MINSLTWGPIQGGLLGGKVAYHVWCHPEGNYEDSEIVFKIFNTKRGDCKSVIFIEPDDSIASMAKALRDAGYEVVVLTSTPIFRLWYDPRIVNYLILDISMKPWTAFLANEIRYRPAEDAEILEPPLPPEAENVHLYIYESARYPDVMQFIANSKHKWGVIPDTVLARQDLLKESKETKEKT